VRRVVAPTFRPKPRRMPRRIISIVKLTLNERPRAIRSTRQCGKQSVGAVLFLERVHVLCLVIIGNPYVNEDRLVQCQHCKEDDGGKD
ncbi:hypothetical protein BMJ22_00065, partial [Sinorhizobium medicae]